MRRTSALLLLALAACSSPEPGAAPKKPDLGLTTAPSPYQTRVIDFVAERGTKRGVILRLYQRYNAGNRDRAMLDVIESSEAAYEAVTLSACVNPILVQDGSPNLMAVARKLVKAGEAEALVAKAITSLPKDRTSPSLVDPKQPLEKRAHAALEGLMGYTNVGTSDNVSLFRANAVFYYYLSLGTDGACVASPELKTIVGVTSK